ncbi:hypothetical protein DPMN_025138 [Dreissena polymorpha]|uniref:Uncharacterized protein n=1 Tax=Dreissena polymorpha TaxID=45954 RepID=A0A9D4RD14_DREPO|nr:hypothetical protein DPMN_025138 [Dreissena polymorpha]
MRKLALHGCLQQRISKLAFTKCPQQMTYKQALTRMYITSCMLALTQMSTFDDV